MVFVKKISWIISIHENLLHENDLGYKFLQKLYLLSHHKCLDTIQGVFRKEETKGYVILNLKIDFYKCGFCVNEPKKNLEYTFLLFSQVHQVQVIN